MKHIQRTVVLALCSILLMGLAGCGSRESRARRQFDQFLQTAFVERMESDYLTMHQLLEQPEALGVHAGQAEVSLGSAPGPEAFRAYRDAAAQQIKTLQGMDRTLLTPQQQDTYDLCVFDARRNAELYQEKFDYYHSFFGGVSGIHIALPTLLTNFRIQTEQDVRDCITLIQDTPRLLSQCLAYVQEQKKQGALLDDCTAAADYCRSVVQAGTDCPVMTALQQQIDLSELTAAQKESYRQQVQHTVMSDFLPAYEALAAGLSQLAEGAVLQSCAALPDGQAYYEALFRSAMGTSRSVEDYQMDLTALYQTQRKEAKEILSARPEAAGLLLKDLFQTGFQTDEEILSFLKEKMNLDFPDAGALDYTVEDIAPSLAAQGQAAYFFVPAIDSTAPHTIRVNRTNQALEPSSVKLYQVLSHEGFPGHMYQSALAKQNLAGQPYRRAFLSWSGFAEGYATYAELTALQYLELDQDALALYRASVIGQNCVIALLEIGIHYNGWTQAQAVSYLQQHGFSQGEREIYAQLLCAPVSFVPYYAGMAEFLSLRQEAEEALGQGFQVKQFHTALLQNGNVTFDVLRQKMQAWLSGFRNREDETAQAA